MITLKALLWQELFPKQKSNSEAPNELKWT